MLRTAATESRYSFYRIGWVNPEIECTIQINFCQWFERTTSWSTGQRLTAELTPLTVTPLQSILWPWKWRLTLTIRIIICQIGASRSSRLLPVVFSSVRADIQTHGRTDAHNAAKPLRQHRSTPSECYNKHDLNSTTCIRCNDRKMLLSNADICVYNVIRRFQNNDLPTRRRATAAMDVGDKDGFRVLLDPAHRIEPGFCSVFVVIFIGKSAIYL